MGGWLGWFLDCNIFLIFNRNIIQPLSIKYMVKYIYTKDTIYYSVLFKRKILYLFNSYIHNFDH